MANMTLVHRSRVPSCLRLHGTEVIIQSTYHEVIPARNTSLTAMHGSASGSNVRYYPT
jgi:hypothetical protein